MNVATVILGQQVVETLTRNDTAKNIYSARTAGKYHRVIQPIDYVNNLECIST